MEWNAYERWVSSFFLLILQYTYCMEDQWTDKFAEILRT